MSLYTERDEISGVVTRLLDNLAATNSSQSGRAGSSLRHQIGMVRTNYFGMMRGGTFSTELLTCFTLAQEAQVSLIGLDFIFNELMAETTRGHIASAVVQAAVLFCLSTQSRIVAGMTFDSREDVEIMIVRMRTTFNAARDLAADKMDSISYQSLTSLAGSLTNHLSSAARPLPRMVSFELPLSVPALVASNRIYYDAARWVELAAENKTIHPLFMQRQLKGLSV